MDDDAARARLTQLWIDHKPSVERFVRRRRTADVDDTVQQVFLTAWRRIDDVPDEPQPWLFTVARNAMLNDGRASRRKAAMAVRLASTIEVATSSDDHDDHDDPALTDAWQALSDAEREAIVLEAWDGLTGEQAAQVLGITRSAYAKRLARARQHLRTLLTASRQTDPSRFDEGNNHEHLAE